MVFLPIFTIGWAGLASRNVFNLELARKQGRGAKKARARFCGLLSVGVGERLAIDEVLQYAAQYSWKELAQCRRTYFARMVSAVQEVGKWAAALVKFPARQLPDQVR